MPVSNGVSQKIARISDISLSKNLTANSVQIDTTRIQVLESNNYISYTFQVVQDSLEKTQVLKNYVLTVINDTLINQQLVSYPVMGNRLYDLQNAHFTKLTGDAIYDFSKSGCDGTVIDVWQNVIINVNCQNNGNHSPGQSCAAGSDPDKEAYSYTVGMWVQTCIPYLSYDGSDPPGGSDSNGGGGGANTDPGPEPVDELVIGMSPNDGLNPIRGDKECEKISDIMNNSNPTSVDFKNKMKVLTSTVASASNEVSLTMFENDSNIVRVDGQQGSGRTNMATSSNDILAFYHLHNNAPGGTYSVLSYADLETFFLRMNDLDNNFVGFLSTHHGTNYAFTFESRSKLQNFFASYTEPNYAPSDSAIERSIRLKRNKLAKAKQVNLILKYFGTSTPLIDQTSSDVDVQLLNFLNFLKEADIGVQFFETDNNFSNFTKLSLENDQIKRKPC